MSKHLSKHQNISPRIWRTLTSITIAPLFGLSVWVAIATHKTLLAQAAEITPVFELPSSLPNGTTTKVDGSNSMTVINEALKQRFEEKFPGTTVSLAANGTAEALKTLVDGKVDLAAIGRPLTDAEKAQGLKLVPISREKIAIVVGEANPFKGSLTSEQFAQIFRGEITNWSQVGGPDAPIRFIDRPESSDTRQAFLQYPVFNTTPFKAGANATPVAEDDTALVVKELGKDGIGYAIASQVVNQPNVSVLPMHETLPSDPRYPYSQPRGYVYKGDASPGVQAFIGFATSVPGQEVVAAAKGQEAATVQQGGATATPDVTITAPSPSPVAVPEATAHTPSLWWLLLPLLGLPLLLWLLKGRGAAVPPVAGDPRDGRIILTPRNCRNAYAYWEVPESQLAEAGRQGGRNLKVRLYDVTNISDMDRQTPHTMKEFDCRENDQDLHLPIAVDDRDYVAELGYLTTDNRWMRIARSAHVRVPACAPIADGGGLKAAAAIAGSAAAVTGATVVGRSLATESRVIEPSRIIMVPRTPQNGYVYWEVPEARKAELRQQGGQKLMVRLHDATNINLDQQNAHSTQQYECPEAANDLHVSIPAPTRDYVAELGYATSDNGWLSIAKSTSVHVPASIPGVVDSTSALERAARAAATQLSTAVDRFPGNN